MYILRLQGGGGVERVPGRGMGGRGESVNVLRTCIIK